MLKHALRRVRGVAAFRAEVGGGAEVVATMLAEVLAAGAVAAEEGEEPQAGENRGEEGEGPEGEGDGEGVEGMIDALDGEAGFFDESGSGRGGGVFRETIGKGGVFGAEPEGEAAVVGDECESGIAEDGFREGRVGFLGAERHVETSHAEEESDLVALGNALHVDEPERSAGIAGSGDADDIVMGGKFEAGV